MYIVHNIGNLAHQNYNTRKEIMNVTEPISFDGVYKSVWENRDILREKDVILFVVGGYVGGNNKFNYSKRDGCPRPYERFADWNEIMDLVLAGAKLGWHTWTHPILTKINDESLKREVTPPFPMDYFAYPGGVIDNRVIGAVKSAGFKEAYSVRQGDNTKYQRSRKYIRDKLNL